MVLAANAIDHYYISIAPPTRRTVLCCCGPSSWKDRRTMRMYTIIWLALASLVALKAVQAFQNGVDNTSRRAPSRTCSATTPTSLQMAKSAATADVPPLKRNPKRKICLMVEPTPFTHVSGYANRFKEMLKFLKKAGDNVDILTVDSKTPAHDLPTTFMGFPIEHTLGFTFPLYNQISLTFDLPEAKGAAIIERRKPDLIHVTSPYVYPFSLRYRLRVLQFSQYVHVACAPLSLRLELKPPN